MQVVQYRHNGKIVYNVNTDELPQGEPFQTRKEAECYADCRNAGADADAAWARVLVVRASRERARLSSQARTEAMKSVGMTRTKYGWE